MRWKDYLPKSVVCLKEGYNKQLFLQDLIAGASVGIIALPLALAFAIASGVAPDKGLVTAVVAGFLISLLGGSRVQIGGPTGAFVVIVYGVVQKHGYDGLALATLVAGILTVIMGTLRFGVLLKFIPYPVTTGFTTGIALVIFSTQVRDFFGLQIEHMPPSFLDKWVVFYRTMHTASGSSFLIASVTLISLIFLRRFYPRLPGGLIAIAFSTALCYLLDLPLATIEKKFGVIPRSLPMPSWPHFSFELLERVFPDAITIALLGAIESLLSAVVADGITGQKHRSNAELIGQGLANIGSVFFGGMPATGAIARTTANIRLGAKTPLAGMIHAITVLLLMIFLAPIAGKIPLAALAGILVFIAWNMSELTHFFEILRGQKGDAIVLLTTFFLTLLFDLTVAVQVGVILAAVVFLKRMTDKTTVEVCQVLVHENEHEGPAHKDRMHFLQKVPEDIAVFEMNGPFFYSVADLLDEALIHLEKEPKVFIFYFHKTPLIDATGVQALKKFSDKCKKKKIIFLIAGVNEHHQALFSKSRVEKHVGKEHLFLQLNEALSFAKKLLI